MGFIVYPLTDFIRKEVQREILNVSSFVMLKFFFNHAFGFESFFIAIEVGLNVKFYRSMDLSF